MATIELSRGLVTVVDDDVFDFLSQWKWCAYARKRDGRRTAMRGDYTSGRRVTVWMHRLIVSAPPGTVVDHINHDGLDNRRCNLRVCTNQENTFNQKAVAGSSSRFKGVSYRKGRGKWQAHVGYNWRKLFLGNFDREEDAALAYNEAAIRLYGEFALLNEVTPSRP